MENTNIKELLEKLASGQISREEFFLFLQKIGQEANSVELDQAMEALFDEKLGEDEKQANTDTPHKDSDLI